MSQTRCSCFLWSVATPWMDLWPESAWSQSFAAACQTTRLESCSFPSLYFHYNSTTGPQAKGFGIVPGQLSHTWQESEWVSQIHRNQDFPFMGKHSPQPHSFTLLSPPTLVSSGCFSATTTASKSAPSKRGISALTSDIKGPLLVEGFFWGSAYNRQDLANMIRHSEQYKRAISEKKIPAGRFLSVAAAEHLSGLPAGWTCPEPGACDPASVNKEAETFDGRLDSI